MNIEEQLGCVGTYIPMYGDPVTLTQYIQDNDGQTLADIITYILANLGGQQGNLYWE